MGAEISADIFVARLAGRHRVLLIGGLAVIAHGLSRKTKDVDVWLEPMEDGTRLPSETHLLVTKANTGREQDWQDQLFLEGRLKKRYRERLPVCGAAEARELMERYLDPEVLAFALDNPDAEVRAMALAHLHEFEAEGDPYSRDILAARRAKNPAD